MQRFFGVYNLISEKLKAQVRPAFLASRKYDVRKPAFSCKWGTSSESHCP